jgi:arginase family enzyme
MNLTNYFHEVDPNNISIDLKNLTNQFTFSKADKNTDNEFINKYQIALIGIPEQRNSLNKGTANAPDRIREQLYKLAYSGKLKLIDMGNLKIGKSINDTYTAVRDILSQLIFNKVIPIIIGGSQDLTYAVYDAYNKLEKQVSIVSIDPKFDMGYQKSAFDSESYLAHIILNKGKYLYNFTNLGYQSYYCTKDELKLLNKMNFDFYRLGQIRTNIEDIEPVMRDADMISLDIRAIKHSDAPAHKFPSPNGFYSEEICQLARYAGLSDKVSSFGIFDVNPDFDINGITSGLAAQIIWYFIDGLNSRQKDFPKEKSREYTKHIVTFEKTEQNIVFYQNNYNKRWWMEVSLPKNQKNHKIVACTFNDYKLACNQELPDRWLKTIQKLC